MFASPRLAAVADGVGGAVAGEVASQTAINEMIALEKRRLTGGLAAELRDAVEKANAALGFLASCRPELAGMGTTLTAVALSNHDHYLVANVGDSRTYLYRRGRLRRLTRDQSFVQLLIDRGAITAEEARSHPQRSLVLEALDGADRTIPPPTCCEAEPGDRLLLCSDGVSDFVCDPEIAEVMKVASRDLAARHLITLALAAGSRDNVSAVVADLLPRDDAGSGWLDALPAPGPQPS